MVKKKPSGFIATCQCGVVVGALDYKRTDKKESCLILGKWLNEGCTVSPKFEQKFEVVIYSCKCK